MANSNPIAIKVENVRKTFKLPHESHSGIKQAALNIFSRSSNRGYEAQKVLDGINFDINRGDFFGIVGRNGSGKSTLLKLLAGIYTPDSGTVEVNGTLTPFIELGVGFNPELTGKENVYLNGALLGFNHGQIDEMYDDIVDFAELSRFMDQKLKNYSSGMQVRLAFSIAIRSKSDILILDEVLAVGDEAFQKKCNKFFMDIKKDKTKTVVLVTHSMDSVRRYCNRALLLEKGKILLNGVPDDVADDYSRQFITQIDEVGIKKEKNRYGTSEVVYQNITHTINDKWFILDFDLINKTKTDYNTITMGFDFCINNDIIFGNDTRFLRKYKNGITLNANKKKHFKIKFPNILGNYTFTLNMNITTDMGLNVTDHIRKVIEFGSTNIQYSDAFKILAFPEITEEE